MKRLQRSSTARLAVIARVLCAALCAGAFAAPSSAAESAPPQGSTDWVTNATRDVSPPRVLDKLPAPGQTHVDVEGADPFGNASRSAASQATKPSSRLRSETTSQSSLSKVSEVRSKESDEQAALATSGVHPAATDSPIANLPALGKVPGAAAKSTPYVIRSQPGVNDIVAVALSFPNRIATPFSEPKVVDMSNASYQTIGSSIFVLPADDKPFGVFITDSTPGAPVISLTLVPKRIPGVNLILDVAGFDKGSAPPEQRPTDDYAGQLRSLLRTVARDKAPDGYAEEVLNVPLAFLESIEATPEKHYSGQAFDIYRYKLRNAGRDALTLSEQSFYAPGVRAVAFFPSILLRPGQETAVLILNGRAEGP